MDAHRHADFDLRSHCGLVQWLTTPGHIDDLFTKAIMLSFSTILLPGENSVIVPLPSVVVVVVVVSATCAHANGAATANAILSITFFMPL
jgi:hypothetical protein